MVYPSPGKEGQLKGILQEQKKDKSVENNLKLIGGIQKSPWYVEVPEREQSE